MKSARRTRPSSAHPAGNADALNVGGRLSRTARIARRNAGQLAARAAGVLQTTRSGAADTTSALQVLPDSTLRSLAATSIGVGTGFYLARRSRLAVAAGIAPAVLAGLAIILRPAAVTRTVRAKSDAKESAT